ncbi:hypothetical protein C8R43DRAFT_1002063 [Mycena crocata]|nr:hypothetical protein C8R43DRAFT_1002063 [Mycena crocata]
MESTEVPNFSIDLQSYRIPGHDACYYIPNFVSEDEEEYMIRKIEETPQQRWKQLANRRLQLWGGELTSKNVLVAQPMPPCVETYPDIIDRLKGTGIFSASPHGKPNYIIMNEYLAGQGIMPHQDGPAYFPCVATISLGSHAIFHYYQYRQEVIGLAPNGAEGRSIDPAPVLSILLEPRSVVISKDALYSTHLHAIREIEEDIITAGSAATPPILADLGVPIANWDRVTGPDMLQVMSEGGVMRRSTRYSLTCRDVEKVVLLKAFMKR